MIPCFLCWCILVRSPLRTLLRVQGRREMSDENLNSTAWLRTELLLDPYPRKTTDLEISTE